MANNRAVSVHVKGLKELDRALGKADKNLRTDLRDGLRDISDTVASEARSTASRKGLRDTGDLIRGIRPFVVSGRAGVRSSAVHGGYEYPRRLEYEGRTGGVYGRRASLNPAVDASLDEIGRAMEDLLDAMSNDFDSGGI